jgi:hypothetical protein
VVSIRVISWSVVPNTYLRIPIAIQAHLKKISILLCNFSAKSPPMVNVVVCFAWRGEPRRRP